MILVKKISVMAVLQLILTLLSAITISYYFRTIGVSNFGIMGVAIAINQYFLLIVEYGFTLTAARIVSQNIFSKEEISKLFFSILFVKVLVFILGFLFLVSTLELISINSKLLALIKIGTMIVLGNLLIPNWLFLGKDLMRPLVVMTIIPRFIALPFIFGLVNEEKDLNLAMLCYSAPILATGILANIYVNHKKWIGLHFSKSTEVKLLLIHSWPLFLSSIATNFYTSLTPLIINIFAGAYATGIFTGLEKIRNGLLATLTPISQIIFPKINKVFSKNTAEGYSLVRKIAISLLSGAIIISFFLISLSSILPDLIFGSYVKFSSVSLIVFSFSIIFNVLSLILGMYIFIPLGLAREYANTSVFVGVFHVLFLSLLSHNFSFLGATICLLTTEILLASLLLFKLRNMNNNFKKVKYKDSILFRICNGI